MSRNPLTKTTSTSFKHMTWKSLLANEVFVGKVKKKKTSFILHTSGIALIMTHQITNTTLTKKRNDVVETYCTEENVSFMMLYSSANSMEVYYLLNKELPSYQKV